MTDTQYIHLRELIRATLKSDTVKVIFTKADGTERVIKCTLDFEIIPEDKHPKTSDKAVVENTEFKRTALRVFDVDVQEWRSFKPETVLSINGLKIENLGIF
jgi:hypothetical protein